MGWPSRTLINIYGQLLRKHDREAFTLSDVAAVSGSYGAAKVFVHRLRKAGWVYRFRSQSSPEARRAAFRLCEPDAGILYSAGIIRDFEKVKQQEYLRLIGIYAAEALKEIPAVKALVLYGSVARGTSKPDSDVDFLVVVKDDTEPMQVMDILIDIEGQGRIRQEIEWLSQHGVNTHTSVFPMRESKLDDHPYLLLDIVIDGITIFDEGVFSSEAEKLRGQLKEMGAKRKFLEDDDWFWDLMPNYRPGMVVEV